MKEAKVLIAAIFAVAILTGTAYKLTEEKIKKAFEEASDKYGADIARTAERIYRKETAHFTSIQFLKGFSPGMEAHGDSFPWGWTSMADFWRKNNKYMPVGMYSMAENDGLHDQGGKVKRFLKFPSVKAAVFSLCVFLEKYNNNGGRWYSTNYLRQRDYNNSLLNIKTHYT